MSLAATFDRLAAKVPAVAEHLPMIRIGRRLGKADALGDICDAVNALHAEEPRSVEYLKALLDVNAKLQELSRRYRGNA